MFQVRSQPPPVAAVAVAPAILSAANLPAAEPRRLTTYERLSFVSAAAVEPCACAVCSNAAFAPPNLPCGHLYCRSCLQGLRSALCPQCRAPFDRIHLPPVTMFVQLKIWQLRVRCQWAANGCEWTDMMGTEHRNVDAHERVCEHRSVACAACRTTVTVRNVSDHPDQCPARIVRCSFCQQKMQHGAYLQHRASPQAIGAGAAPCDASRVCSNACTTDGRTTVLPTAAMAVHQATTCSLRKVRCPQCECELLASELAPHRDSACPHRRVKCEHCSANMQFAELAAHQPPRPQHAAAAASASGNASADDNVPPPAAASASASASTSAVVDNVPPCKGFVLCTNACKDAQQRTTMLPCGELAAHLAECPLRKAICPDCKKEILTRGLDTHKKDTCVERIVTCRHCKDQFTFLLLTKGHLHSGAKKSHALCAGMQLCARGCKEVHRKDAAAQHLEKCARRPAECPCCTPAVAVAYCDVLAHVKAKLGEESQRDGMAQLLMRLHKDNKQLREEQKAVKAEAKRAMAHAADQLQRDKAKLAKERHGWHETRNKNDKIHERNRAMAADWIHSHNACRSKMVFGKCDFGRENCKYNHLKLPDV